MIAIIAKVRYDKVDAKEMLTAYLLHSCLVVAFK
jgi:hypothetical protein